MSRIFKLIRGRPDPAIDLALAAALPTAGPAAAGPIVEALLERRRLPAATALIEQYHRLPPPLRRRIAETAKDLTPAIRRAAAATRSPTAENALDLIESTPLASLTYLVTGILRRGDAPRRAAAAQTLLALTQRCLPDAQPRLPAPEIAHVVAGVEESVNAFGQHREARTLQAALLLLTRRMNLLSRVLEDAEHPATAELRQMLHAAATTTVRRALLPALGYASLRPSAVAGLRRALAKGHLSDVLHGGGVLRLPEIAAAVGAMDHAEGLWPADVAGPRLGEAEQLALVDWACCLPGGPAQAVERLGSLCALEQVAARMAALQRLRALSRVTATDRAGLAAALAAFVEDAHASIAVTAARQVLHLGGADQLRWLARWSNSPHPAVARLAEAKLAPAGFARLWEGWSALPHERRLALARAMIKLDPCFHAHLAEKLLSKQPAVVVRALAMISCLGQATFFVGDLLRLTRSAQPRVAATAVAALGAVDDERAAHAVVVALDHEDARVRANAIEAVAGPALAGQPAAQAALHRLRKLTHDPANRPRANAIHAVLRLVGDDAEADAELDRMLQDQRPAHRLSAVWLVESEGMIGRSARLAEMAVADTDQQVQARARQAFERMVSLLRPADDQTMVRPSPVGALARIGSAATGGGLAQQGAA